MSRTTGLCLTTKNTSGRNGVWLSRCGYDTGQFWNYAYLYTSLTYHTLMSDAGLDCVFCSLRMSPGYTSVYNSDFIADEEDYNIPLTAHMWNGTTHS